MVQFPRPLSDCFKVSGRLRNKDKVQDRKLVVLVESRGCGFDSHGQDILEKPCWELLGEVAVSTRRQTEEVRKAIGTFFFGGGGVDNQTEKLFYCKRHRNTSLALFVGNHEILTGN